MNISHNANIIKISFRNLHSFGNLQGLTLPTNAGGVYIWGPVFKKNKNNKPVGSPLSNSVVFNPSNHIFIPYYVGQSQDKLLYCFKRHNNPLSNNRYLRLEYNYMKHFFNDPLFPEMIETGVNQPRTWFNKNPGHFTNKIIYYNNSMVLKGIYGLTFTPDKDGSFRINTVKRDLASAGRTNEIKVLNRYVPLFDKMFFCYATGFNTAPSLKYKDFEAYIFYRLKGKTASKHDHYDRMKKKFCGLRIKINSGLYLFKPDICRCFNGY
ncbi:MAG: hypothetical protein ACJ75B_06785 [Flavisolibacter sp.]